MIELRARNKQETEGLARRLAPLLAPGDVIFLRGSLGAGKSHFARTIIRALTRPDAEAPSPTFTLVQTYEAPRFEIWHFDLYRLKREEEAFELGLEEALEGAVSLIEWPERLGASAPGERLDIELARPLQGADSETLDADALENGPRLIRIEGRGRRGEALERALTTE